MVNAIIRIDPMHLGRATETIDARAGGEFVALLVGVPDDVEEVVVRVCPDAQGGGFYDFPAHRAASGEWHCRILGTAFSGESRGWYEVRAKSAAGCLTALGRGGVVVRPFSDGGVAETDSRVREVMIMPDRNGAMHRVFAEQDETGAWTFVIGDVDG
jgi:hypothetical protein